VRDVPDQEFEDEISPNASVSGCIKVFAEVMLVFSFESERFGDLDDNKTLADMMGGIILEQKYDDLSIQKITETSFIELEELN